MDAWFLSCFNGLSTVQIQMVQPSILKSHKPSEMIETHFYRLYSIMNGFKIIADSLKSMAHDFVVAVSIILPLCCHIGWGMPYMCIFGEKVVPLLGPMADKWE